MPIKLSTPRTFDYVPRLDERNLAHRISADPYGSGLAMRSRYWVPGSVVTNQGSEGACVGHGVVNEAMASPVRVIPGRRWTTLLHRDVEANNVAATVYSRAKEIDEWEGVDYDGTSVRAGMLVGRERGWWEGFRWALNMGELRAALEEGPVVIGVEWREGMYDTWIDGQVRVTGSTVGWHCLLVTGYAPSWNGWGRPYYRWRNSWGPSYGRNGSAYIHADDLNSILFKAGGEAAVAIGRKL